MKKSKNDYFVVYNQSIDGFVKVRQLSDEDLQTVFDALGEAIKKPDFKASSFAALLCKLCLEDFSALASQDDGDCPSFLESIYECVTEVYPMLSIELVCRHANIKDMADIAEKEKDKKCLNLTQIDKLSTKLKTDLIGQDDAVDKVIECVKLINSGFESFASLFFIGPTGVGKTELARLMAKHYLKDASRLVKINCGEYSNPHEYAKLIGSPPGYIGFNEKGILTEKADEGSEWVILFDEVEKASGKLHNLLLGFLDDGVITDNHGASLDFTNSVIIFTSNVGLANVGKKQLGFGAEKTTYSGCRELIDDEFKRRFTPEFINRLDHIIHFNELTKENVREIAKIHLKVLPIKVTKRLVNYVVEKSYSREFGAREVKRFIRSNITLRLADEILHNGRETTYTPRFSEGELSHLEIIK
jgi:ATP-dependent Clp protease ATP-binding subunit ClpA